jgi:hypothetical protein
VIQNLEGALALANQHELIRGDIRKRLSESRGPSDFDGVGSFGMAQAEVQPQVTMRHEARAACDFTDLRAPAGSNAHARTDGAPVGTSSGQLQREPIAFIPALIPQQV